MVITVGMRYRVVVVLEGFAAISHGIPELGVRFPLHEHLSFQIGRKGGLMWAIYEAGALLHGDDRTVPA